MLSVLLYCEKLLVEYIYATGSFSVAGCNVGGGIGVGWDMGVGLPNGVRVIYHWSWDLVS